MNERERILDRIKKLMNFNGGNATQGEVENALRLAKRLMNDLNVSEEELNGTKKSTEEFELVDLFSRLGKLERMDQWVFGVLSEIFDTFAFHSIRSSYEQGRAKQRTYACVAGYKTDIRLTQQMINEVRIWMRAEARKRYGSKWGVSHTSFCEGFATGLHGASVQWRKDLAEKGVLVSSFKKEKIVAWLWETHGIDFRPKPSTTLEPSAAEAAVQKLLKKKPRKRRERKFDPEASNAGYDVGRKYDMGTR